MKVLSLPIIMVVLLALTLFSAVQGLAFLTTDKYRGVVWSGTNYEVVSLQKNRLSVTVDDSLYAYTNSSNLIFEYLKAKVEGDTLSLSIRKNGNLSHSLE